LSRRLAALALVLSIFLYARYAGWL